MGKDIRIGNREFGTMTIEEILKIAILEGCTPSLKFWNEPIITDFNYSMFSNSIFIEYFSTKIKDGLKSETICFSFNFKKFTFSYTKDYEVNGKNFPVKRISIQTLKYLINQKFDIPIY